MRREARSRYTQKMVNVYVKYVTSSCVTGIEIQPHVSNELTPQYPNSMKNLMFRFESNVVTFFRLGKSQMQSVERLFLKCRRSLELVATFMRTPDMKVIPSWRSAVVTSRKFSVHNMRRHSPITSNILSNENRSKKPALFVLTIT